MDSFRVRQIGPQTMFGPVAGGPLQRPDDSSIHGGNEIENLPLCQDKFACILPGAAPAYDRFLRHPAAALHPSRAAGMKKAAPHDIVELKTGV